jgi:hypothetical protein
MAQDFSDEAISALPESMLLLGGSADAISSELRATAASVHTDHHVPDRGAARANTRSSSKPRTASHPTAVQKNMSWNRVKHVNRMANRVSEHAGSQAGPGQMKLIAEQLTRLNRNFEVLSSAIRAQHSSADPPLSEMNQTYMECSIDYTDKRPTVEVSVEVLEVSDFHLTTGIFHAAFNVVLDWEEPEFVEGVHYHQDQRSRQFVISSWLLEDSNTFNPRIFIENPAEVLKGSEDPDYPFEPRIHRLLTRGSGEKARESVWLTKTYSFSGTLQCAHVDASQFPWDMQRLPIKIKSLPMNGQTTLGKPRNIKLAEPCLRKLQVLEAARKKGIVDKTSLLKYDEYYGDRAISSIEAHRWSMVDKTALGDDVAVPNFEVGEMKVCAFGGSDPAPDQYQVEMVVLRTWTTYFFDFWIQMLLVAISLSTCWVPFNDDCVPNRLSISMTIVLAIVFFATTKPAAIADLTYNTQHDFWDQCMLLLTVSGCVENVFVYVQCWGLDRSGKEDWEAGDGSLIPAEWCKEGSTGASIADQYFFIGMLISVVATFMYMLINAQQYRIRYLVRVRRELGTTGSVDLDVKDDVGWQHTGWGSAVPCHLKGEESPMKGSKSLGQLDSKSSGSRRSFSEVSKVGNRLMLPCTSPISNSKMSRFVGFAIAQATNHSDANAQIAYCIARHGMPFLRIFPSFWVSLAMGKCPIRCPCRCKTLSKKVAPPTAITALASQMPGASIIQHGLHGEGMAGGRDQSPSGKKAEELPSGEWMNEYVGARPTLPAGEPARIVDCGTGEIGFYEYRWRTPKGSPADEKPMLYLDKGDKMSMSSGKTFLEEFAQTQDGSQKFADELADRYFAEEVGDDEVSPISHLPSGALTSSIRSTDIRPPSNQSVRSLSQSVRLRQKKVKILFGPTGQNRQSIVGSRDTAERMVKWVQEVEDFLNARLEDTGYVVDVLLFIPTEKDEATYELVATEFLVQKGDLQVTDWQGNSRVPFAGLELSQALMRGGQSRFGIASGVLSLQEFLREFGDLMDSEIDREFMQGKFDQAVAESSPSLGGQYAESTLLGEVIRSSPQLMRSLVKNRLFNGTLSAGGGSCQITVKPDHEERLQFGARGARAVSRVPCTKQVMRTSDFFSVKVGNKTPTNVDSSGNTMWPKFSPMSDELIDVWRAHIKKVMDAMDLPHKLQGNLRGVYIGISAIFYAAKSAGCAETLLPKAIFLERLNARLKDLLAHPPQPVDKNGELVYDHREFANIVLVRDLISRVMADTAWIVCKRNWKAQPASLETNAIASSSGAAFDGQQEPLPTYVATWSLGFYLSQAA